MHASRAALSCSRQCFHVRKPADVRAHTVHTPQCSRRSSRRPACWAALRSPAPPVLELADSGLLQDLLTTTLAGGIIAAVTLSALPLLSGRAQESRVASVDEEEDTVQWSVMGVVSCIPLIDWTAWIFAALNSDSPAGYYALAALYAAPWLKEGLRLDGFTLFALLLCAAHVQVERIKATEPETVASVGTGALDERARAGRKALGDSTSAVTDRLEQTVRRGREDADEIVQRSQGAHVERTERELREAEEALVKQELQRWDETFRSKNKQPEDRG